MSSLFQTSSLSAQADVEGTSVSLFLSTTGMGYTITVDPEPLVDKGFKAKPEAMAIANRVAAKIKSSFESRLPKSIQISLNEAGFNHPEANSYAKLNIPFSNRLEYRQLQPLSGNYPTLSDYTNHSDKPAEMGNVLTAAGALYGQNHAGVI